MQEVNAASVSALSKADFQHLVPRSWSDIQIRCCNLTENTSEEHKENLGDRQVPQFTSPFPGCVSVGDGSALTGRNWIRICGGVAHLGPGGLQAIPAGEGQ